MNFTFPIASSSEAEQAVSQPYRSWIPYGHHWGHSLGCRVGWRIATRSFYSDYSHQQMFFFLSMRAAVQPTSSSAAQIDRQPQRTFNICSSVVFPALSRPRNRSFACLFISPRAERVSQTVVRSGSAAVHNGSASGGLLRDQLLLTPVDNPHTGQVMISGLMRCWVVLEECAWRCNSRPHLLDNLA